MCEGAGVEVAFNATSLDSRILRQDRLGTRCEKGVRGNFEATTRQIVPVTILPGGRGRLRYAGQDLFRCVGGPLVDGTFIVIRDQDMGKETG